MMVLGKIKAFIMNNNVFTVSLLIAILGLLFSIVFYKYTEIRSLERNVESAIVKGIDPIAVRCAYSRESDVICVAYATTHQQPILTSKSGK